MTLRQGWGCGVFIAMAAMMMLTSHVTAGTLRERLQERRAQSRFEAQGQNASTERMADVRIRRDVPYGDEPKQRYDVYLPMHAQHAPVIFLVHGGAWRHGDKTNSAVVANKVERWLPRGFIVVSINYRLLPQASPLEQVRDVARALASAQNASGAWGGDRTRFILMGHSAGAHLVSMVTASPALAAEAGVQPWLGTIALDSAAFDVELIMRTRHLPLYDQAFGKGPQDWRAASPYHLLTRAGVPLLAVCSSRRSDSCPQAQRFAAKAANYAMRTQVLEQDLSHREINELLGSDADYTRAVETFIAK